MVSFSNSEADAILKYMSVNIFSGEKVALVGRPNAEKHALVSCLFRFMEPMRGSIKIDGVNIAWVMEKRGLFFYIFAKDAFFFFFDKLDWC
jgi:ABC-type multidrug transport system fused ATPase/permease subunit